MAASDVQKMFDTMTSTFFKSRDASRVHGKLRVATMCSGTESPLLSLRKISDSLIRLYGITLDVDHVFSCEIEPFKQAYIERNFAPKLLFRDIRELGSEKAATAYGAMRLVPGDVDMLVAGTSCVDYSNLNNDKKSIDDKGESGQTFRGMMAWVKKNKPPIVLLENVCQAPWEIVAKKFEEIGYASHFIRLDTKKYHIPHTRTRVYLLAILSKDPDVVRKWKQCVKSLESPAAGALESFLFNSDDPRLESKRDFDSAIKKRGRISADWSRCESRHKKFRLDEKLGESVPLTSWPTGCRLPEHAWNDWGKAQPERVLDLIDIYFLRCAAKNVDATYKSMAWNLSQNVDRSGGEAILGVTPCLTPSMIPFATIRGGPIIGLESLSLQGIPVDDLVMTRETETQMKDLSGNAMTTTVVGACMLSALWLHGNLKPPDKKEKKKKKIAIGLQNLRDVRLELRRTSPGEILPIAHETRRLCGCENRDRCAGDVSFCVACKATSCAVCAGNPKHEARTGLPARKNSSALFREELLRSLPMKLAFTQNNIFTDCSDFVFEKLLRGTQWRVIYKSDRSLLELRFVNEDSAVWLFFTEGETSPSARLQVSSKHECLWSGAWETRVSSPPARLTIKGTGDLVASWKSVIGLTSEENRWSSYEISGHDAVSGTYDWLPRCGAAQMSLHKKRGDDVYLFLDPDVYGKSTEDSFVFSRYHHRLVADELRQNIARLDSSFRPFSSDLPLGLSCEVLDEYAESPLLELVPKESLRSLSLTDNIALVSELGSSCENGVAIMKIVAPLSDAEKTRWVHDASDKEKMHRFAWLNSQIKFPEEYERFIDIRVPSVVCNNCFPALPPLRWVRKAGQKKTKCQEDPEAASAYEKSMKCRPEVFDLFWSVSDEYNLGELVVSVNPAALVHRALGLKEGTLRQNGFMPLDAAVTQWRIVQTSGNDFAFDRFALMSNKEDDFYYGALPGWNSQFPLRPEQNRSLSWMVKQETSGNYFEEEEVSEKLFPLLNIRAEGRACRKRLVRGGIVADQVGFGKTAIAVAVISALQGVPTSTSDCTVCTKATLILVPSQLMKQWPNEIEKFCPSLEKVVIKTMADLNALTVEQVKRSDVVLVNTSIFRSAAYFSRLAQLAGVPELPQDSSRQFTAAYDEAVEKLQERMPRIRAGDLSAEPRESTKCVTVVSNRIKGAKLIKTTIAAGGEGMNFVETLDAEKVPDKKPPFVFFKEGSEVLDKMCSPLFEMFHWKRVIVDEFTYLQDFDRRVATAMVADAKWCLSGTPPIADFTEIKLTADLIGINLGVDETATNLSRKEVTKVESFHFYRETCSENWRARRNVLAQKFLDAFARQNIAEIDEIQVEEKEMKVRLNSEEMTLYLELEQHIKILDIKASVRRGAGDRVSRLAKALDGCSTPQEALVKRCSLYEDDVQNTLSLREEQYLACEEDLRVQLRNTDALVENIRTHCGGWPEKYENFFENWKARTISSGTGDPDVTLALHALLKNSQSSHLTEGGGLPSVGAVINIAGMDAVVKAYLGTWKQRTLLGFEDGTQDEIELKTVSWTFVEKGNTSDMEAQMGNKTWETRELTHGGERLLKELVCRRRSLRFFKNLTLPADDLEGGYIFSACGHCGSREKMLEGGEARVCFEKACRAPTTNVSVIQRIKSAVSSPTRHGSKIRDVVDVVKSIPADDKIILFAQFADLAAKLEEALVDAGVATLRLSGGVHHQTKTLDAFQNNSETRALVMLCRSESAAGANLTRANHAIFVHPLITDSVEEYEASETQAIGRMRRYGQSKKVFVWRFVVENTLEENLLRDKGLN